ncbi:hypothetical protein AX17_003541 [Amanita inopinata Kibby_2008]|nr:hypothetical protein AX17_003541 [Amanita inopinata Kibby_2008]
MSTKLQATGHRPSVTLTLKCLSIGANALFAGGIFTLPLLSSPLASHLDLSQPQLTTIVLAGIIGQYPLAPFVGKVVDLYGPPVCSLVAAISYTLSFGGFAVEIATTFSNSAHSSLSSFRRLVFCSLFAGIGTVFSYYSSLFAASKTFPKYIGMASGASMALFGLSPLFLTMIASRYFTDEVGDLNAVRYMIFLAVFSGFVHLLGAFALNDIHWFRQLTRPRTLSECESECISETSALLARRPSSTLLRGASASGEGLPVKDSSFWLLCAFCFCTLGAAEMVFSNIGTIIFALPPKILPSSSLVASANSATAQQVQLLSISNTITRIITGCIVDFVSPAATSVDGVAIFLRKHVISRVFFLLCPSVLLSGTFLWAAIALKAQETAWALSLGVGVSYGAVFTVLPSIVSVIWGADNVGRNFGILMLATFTGTPVFSYIYAFVSQSHTTANGLCIGRGCWHLTFWICCGTSLASFLLSIMMWIRWKGRL